MCNLVAESQRNAEGCLQPGSREGTDGRGYRAVGDCVFQALQEPNCSHRSGTGDIGFDAGFQSIPKLLHGDDLRRLSAGAKLDNGDPETLLFSLKRFFGFLSDDQKQIFLETVTEKTT
jgi:hypothetical protein